MQCHLLSLAAAAVVAIDQSKLSKDNNGQSPCKVVGCKKLNQSNDDNGCRWMRMGATWMASQLQKTMRVVSGGTGTTNELECNAMQGQLQ
jgi:hypothetical protein